MSSWQVDKSIVFETVKVTKSFLPQSEIIARSGVKSFKTPKLELCNGRGVGELSKPCVSREQQSLSGPLSETNWIRNRTINNNNSNEKKKLSITNSKHEIKKLNNTRKVQ